MRYHATCMRALPWEVQLHGQLCCVGLCQGVANVLAAIPFRENKVFVHTDAHLMPRDRRLWASWNFIRPCHARDDAAVCVSYWANRLQVRALFCSLLMLSHA